jgi:hypothetical protein
MQRLRENPDFKVLLAEELEKANGGGECKECTAHAQQCNDALKQERRVSHGLADVTKEVQPCTYRL